MADGGIEEIKDLLGAILIQNARLYDLLALLVADQESFEQLIDLHMKGGILSAPPFFNEEAAEKWNGNE